MVKKMNEFYGGKRRTRKYSQLQKMKMHNVTDVVVHVETSLSLSSLIFNEHMIQ